MTIREKFIHKWLKQPFRLHSVIDEGQGAPVVLLHGLGRRGDIWQNLCNLLVPRGYRVIAYDLLGFGDSPKPDWYSYDVDEHVSAVISSIKALRLGRPVILVGHSMGCLVAVRFARLYPELVEHLVLYEMPLFEGLPQKRHYRLRLDFYRRLYQRLSLLQPTFADKPPIFERAAKKIVGKSITKETWPAYVKSLQNTILRQTAAADIKACNVAMDVIYGSLDIVVIRGKAQKIFGQDATHVTGHTIRERHAVSKKASTFIAARIDAATRSVGINDKSV